MDIGEVVEANLRASIAVKQALLERCAGAIAEAGSKLATTLQSGRSIYLIGNGGSASDAQHIAAELEGRYLVSDRPGLPVQALTTNSSTLTAIGNDYGFDAIFSRQVEAHVREGDALVALSTSGSSPNVLMAAELARKQGAWVLGLTGESGGKLDPVCNLCIPVPERSTARIQECHILIGHTLCDVIEKVLTAG